MSFEKEIRVLSDLIWSDKTDDELVNEIVLYLQNPEINNGYKVELLMELACRSDSAYYKNKRLEFEKNS